MTVDFISYASGIALSLILGFAPKIKEAYNKLDSYQKQLVMLGLALIISLGIFGLSCAGWAEGLGLPVLDCSTNGFQQLLKLFGQVAGATILTYGGTKYLHKS